MSELAGDSAPQRALGSSVQQGLIEDSSGGGNHQGYRGSDRDTDHVKPWDRGPTGGPAPWRDVDGRPTKVENYDGYRNEQRDISRAPPTGPSGGDRPGPPPWQQQQQRPVRDARSRQRDNLAQDSGPTQSYQGNQMDALHPWGRQNAQTQEYSIQQQQIFQNQQMQPQQSQHQSYGYNANVFSAPPSACFTSFHF